MLWSGYGPAKGSAKAPWVLSIYCFKHDPYDRVIRYRRVIYDHMLCISKQLIWRNPRQQESLYSCSLNGRHSVVITFFNTLVFLIQINFFKQLSQYSCKYWLCRKGNRRLPELILIQSTDFYQHHQTSDEVSVFDEVHIEWVVSTIDKTVGEYQQCCRCLFTRHVLETKISPAMSGNAAE